MSQFARREAFAVAASALAATAVGGAVSASSAKAAPAPPTPPGKVGAVRIRGVTIGEGRSKTIVSIAEKTAEDAIGRARALGAMPAVEVVEYRIDHLDDVAPQAIAATMRAVADGVAGKPLIVTFRTKAEGGEKAIAPAAYAAIYEAVLATGAADLIDLEAALLADRAVASAKARIQAAGRKVILSHHDFAKTPPVAEMVALLRRQHAMGGDILKLAVMPHDAGDVLHLLEATWIVRRDYSGRPLITMAMGGVGAVSRLTGEVFGSALSFGAVGQVSAPGQVEVGKLRTTLGVVHDALSG